MSRLITQTHRVELTKVYVDRYTLTTLNHGGVNGMEELWRHIGRVIDIY